MKPDVRVVVERLLRMCAALLAVAAATSWVTPRNVPGKNFVPFGCGAPASPKAGALADFVCSDALARARGLALGLLLSAAVILLISEFLVPRFWGRPWARGISIAAPVAVPLAALSTVRLFQIVASVGADGTLIRCGTPAAPAVDAISELVCGDLAAKERYLSLGGLALAVVLLVGAIYAAASWPGVAPAAEREDGGRVDDEASPQLPDGNTATHPKDRS